MVLGNEVKRRKRKTRRARRVVRNDAFSASL
jgi:hypothetical protein